MVHLPRGDGQPQAATVARSPPQKRSGGAPPLPLPPHQALATCSLPPCPRCAGLLRVVQRDVQVLLAAGQGGRCLQGDQEGCAVRV